MDNPFESDADLKKLEGIGKTTGGRNPYQEDQYQAKLKQYGINPGEDFLSYTTRKQMEQGQKIIQPAVDTLNAGIPEVKDAYTKRQEQVAAEKDPLIQRYDQLLNEIRGRETSQVNDVTKSTNRELGRRGIALSSTFAADETQGRTAPIRSQAQSDILSTTFDRESKLREIDNTITNINSEMVAAERDIRNQVAQLQANAGEAAANRALQVFQIEQQQRQAELDRQLRERELTITQEKNLLPTTEVVEVGGHKKLVNKTTGAIIADLGPSGTGGTGSGNITIGGSTTTTTSTNKIDPNTFLVKDKTKQSLQANLGGINLNTSGNNTLVTNSGNTQPKPAAPAWNPFVAPNSKPLSLLGGL